MVTQVCRAAAARVALTHGAGVVLSERLLALLERDAQRPQRLGKTLGDHGTLMATQGRKREGVDTSSVQPEANEPPIHRSWRTCMQTHPLYTACGASE